MARHYDNTASGGTAVDYHANTTISPVQDRPWVQGCIAKDDASATINDRLAIEFTDGGSAFLNRLGIEAASGREVYFREKANSGAPRAVSTNGYADLEYMAMAGGVETITQRWVWLNGEQFGDTTTATNAPSGLDTTLLAAEWGSGSPNDGWNGDLAEWYAIDHILSAAEALMHKEFFSPAFFNGLLFYIPGFWHHDYTGDEYDLVGGMVLTATGAPTTVNHPPVVYPTGPLTPFQEAGTPPVISGKPYYYFAQL